TDANGDKLSYSWMSQDGQRVSGEDKAVILFTAPQNTVDSQYVVSLTVSDGVLSSTTTYTLNVKAKAADEAADETKDGNDSDVINYPSWSSSQTWKAGDIVNNHGALYQCKPLPVGAWCNVAPSYYEPGVGLAWGDAWKAM
ncbi:MAG: chitinase, partial [Kluyvera sp.]